MSAEVKLVKEDIKNINEGLTLGELGLTVPTYLEERGWDSSIRVNKLYPTKDKANVFVSIFRRAIDEGFFEFALEIIKTADRPDKMGFDPNMPVNVEQPSAPVVWTKTPVPYSPICWVVKKYKEARFDGLFQIVDALFSKGALLGSDRFTEYYKSKGIQTPACEVSEATALKMLMGENLFLFSADYRDANNFVDLEHFLFSKGNMRTTPMMHRIFAEYFMQLELLIKGDDTTDTLDKFKKIINESIPIGRKLELPEAILEIIYSYLPLPMPFVSFDYRCTARISFEKYYNQYRKEKNAEFAIKIAEIRRAEKLEDERRQQIKLARARAAAGAKGDTKARSEMVAVDPIEIIRQQNEMLQQQNEMLHKKTQFISQLITMYQDLKNKSGGGSLGLDTRDTRDAVASAVLSLPVSDSVKEQFEICEPKPHKQ